MTDQRRTEAGQSGDRTVGEPTPFAEVMRGEGMTTPSALRESINLALGMETPEGGATPRGGAQGGGTRSDALSADDLLRAAENLLDKVLATQCENRDSALDLLTVDALVTRAMAAAARDPRSLAEFPELAMKRIAAK